ncbi:hypothetical protein PR048_019026 [Dryococelus australis]|uniref:Uncharacterized protein n=1 Tax=Dryococelus australis TaxID=614101 RepID=A0ABQ9H2D9_9NEOP|nr:hypothetical protein PR048_019026 [Dryococelus australis]
MKPKIGRVKRKVLFSSISLQQQHYDVKDYILLVHGLSGALIDCVTTLNKPGATADEVKKAGERLIHYLNGAKDDNFTIDEMQYN